MAYPETEKQSRPCGIAGNAQECIYGRFPQWRAGCAGRPDAGDRGDTGRATGEGEGYFEKERDGEGEDQGSLREWGKNRIRLTNLASVMDRLEWRLSDSFLVSFC